MSKREKDRLKGGKRTPGAKAAGSDGRARGGPGSRYALSRTIPMQVKDYPPGPPSAVGLGWLHESEEELPFRLAEELAGKLDLSPNQFGERLLGISRAAIGRRRENKRLKPDESAKVLRYSRLQELATELMEGNEAAARDWLFSPLAIFGGEPPLEHARTESGAHEVEQLIGRLEYGVYS